MNDHTGKRRVLLLGGGGQIGQQCRAAWPDDLPLTCPDRADVDIRDRESLERVFAAVQPALVLNAAAYTAVDQAEQDRAAAFAVNRDGAGRVAEACQRHAATLIHFSTDYVFDGEKQGAYQPEDPVSPLGVYGESKAQGEALIRAATARHVILRTAWVFSAFRANFVKTMLRLAQERAELSIVDDQKGCPSGTPSLVRGLAVVARQILDEPNERLGATYHLASKEAVTWFGFAKTIFEEATRMFGWPVPLLHAITTADYPTAARRPRHSVLDCGKTEMAFGFAAPDWRADLQSVLAQIGQHEDRR